MNFGKQLVNFRTVVSEVSSSVGNPVYRIEVSLYRIVDYPEIRELQRSIETNDMRYFPQHVLLCTSTVHDQSANICIQGYLRILWIGNTKSLKID